MYATSGKGETGDRERGGGGGRGGKGKGNAGGGERASSILAAGVAIHLERSTSTVQEPQLALATVHCQSLR